MNPMKNPTCLALVVVLALSLGACGDKTSAPPTSPVAPTAAVPAPAPTPAPTPVGGATVTGSVAVASGPTGLRALSVSSSSYTIVVSVPGTSLSTTVDGVGRFKLTGVPSGTVELKFSGNGMQGSIVLTGVTDADQVDVAVTLSPTGAALQTQERDTGGEVQLEGRIAALNPGGTANTLLVDATTVSVPTTAIIRHGDIDIAFAELKVGDRVHVKGTKNGQTADGQGGHGAERQHRRPGERHGCRFPPAVRLHVPGDPVHRRRVDRRNERGDRLPEGDLREPRERHVGARERRRPVLGAGPGDVGPDWEVARLAAVGSWHVGLEGRPLCVSHSTTGETGSRPPGMSGDDARLASHRVFGPAPGWPGFFPRGSLP